MMPVHLRKSPILSVLQTTSHPPLFLTHRPKSSTEMETEPIFSSSSIDRKRQLIISPEEDTPQNSAFCINENGGKIGRHFSNSILMLEKSVSRHHAEIKYDKNSETFTLNDMKSSTGTYIKIMQSWHSHLLQNR